MRAVAGGGGAGHCAVSTAGVSVSVSVRVPGVGGVSAQTVRPTTSSSCNQVQLVEAEMLISLIKPERDDPRKRDIQSVVVFTEFAM